MQGVDQADGRIGPGRARVGRARPARLAALDRAVARAVLHRDVGDHAGRPGARTTAVVDFVADRIAGSPEPLRLGVRAASLAVLLVLRRVDPTDAQATARALAPLLRRPPPAVGDYVRLVRALTLAAWYDGVGEGPR